MGMVLGKISVEMPKHQVVYTAQGFQVWRYPSSVAAVVTAESLNAKNSPKGSEFSNQAFRTLAKYIGVFGTPANEKSQAPEQISMTAPVVMSQPDKQTSSEPIAMTAPVVMSPAKSPEQIAMTAPVVMDGKQFESMAFLLPAKYETVEDAPVPTNPAVKLELIPERYEAVLQFSGNINMENPSNTEAKAAELLEMLKQEGIEPTGSYQLMGYNPPWTLPWMKRNEIHYPVAENDKFNNSTTAAETM